VKLRITLATLLAGTLAAPAAFAQPGDHHDHPADVHATVRIEVPPVGDHGRRDWQIAHPVVTGYTPLRGEVGNKVVIRGQHFSKDMVVVWGGNPIPGATVSETEISFVVPKGAANGTVYVRGGGLASDLAIGDYEVAKVDKAEWKKRDDARDAEAKAAWAGLARDFKKERKDRDAALIAEEARLEESREQRRASYLAALQEDFNHAFLADPATQAELAFYADRQAKLERIQRIAADLADAKLGVRVEVDIRRENERHDQRMKALKAAFKGA
jgi:hypothetical protein